MVVEEKGPNAAIIHLLQKPEWPIKFILKPVHAF